MSDNENAPEGSQSPGAPEQAGRPGVSVARTRWRLDRQRHHRLVVRAFDRWAVDHYGPDAAREAGIPVPATESGCSCCCHAPPPDYSDYWLQVGMTLGMPERVAAGLALLAEERAA